MKLKIASLLLIITVGAGLLAISRGKHDAGAFTQHVRADLPPGIFVSRIYYKNLEQLNDLAAYDLWEYNNLDQKYVLVSLDGSAYLELEQQGWQLQVDEQQTTELNTATSPFSEGYRTVEELYTYLEQINSRQPHLTELVKYGQSTCSASGGCTTPGGDVLPGHDLLALRISNEAVPGTSTLSGSAVSQGSKPVFFLLANIHAREIVTPEIAMRLIDHLLLNYGQDADVTFLVDWHEIWIVPTANPDGHWLAELGASPIYDQGAFYQRKNANLDADDNGIADCAAWPPASSWQYGVDLNRNHSYSWGSDGSSSEPCSQTFRGPEPASELEVSSLQALVQALIPDQRGESISDTAPQETTGLLITLHSFGDLILWPWGNIDIEAPNHKGLKAIGDKLAVFNKYQSCQASRCLYFTSGTTDDWAYGELGIPAFTYEIGRLFMPPYGEIDHSLWPDNLPSLLYAARIARTPYETILGPDVYNVRSIISVEDETITLTASIDDRDHGGEVIAASTYSIDLPHWADGAETRGMIALDGHFDDQVEAVSATFHLADLGPGSHTLYLNGKDSDGHWGATRAVTVNSEPDRSYKTYFPFNIHFR